MKRPDYKYKTQPRGKQLDVIEGTWHEPCWALLCRPGTGKTKIGLDTAGLNYAADRIDALIVIAPEGVDRQWIKDGVPTHLGDGVPREVGNYRSLMGKLAYQKLERLVASKTKALLIISISFDGLQTPRGKKLITALQSTRRCMTIDDEAHRTSNVKSAVFKAVKPVMRASRVKRIATGTLIRQNPFSAWGQFDLMGDNLLGFASLASFKSMYAEMLPDNHRLVQGIAQKLRWAMEDDPQRPGKRRVKPGVLQIQAKDDNDRPIYRNLNDLRLRLQGLSSFLTLADVNGKEPVVNESTRYVRLSPEQRAMYDDLQQYGVAQAPGGQLTTEGALALSIRLAQIVGGFCPSDDDPKATPLPGVNPKVADLLDIAEDVVPADKLVVWCKYSAEIDAVVGALAKVYGPQSVVQYHGRMSSAQKDASKLAFIEDRECLFFVGQQKAGGTGLDGLQAVGRYMVFYSNDYPYLERYQAISRLARTGGYDVIQVWDIEAEDTIDEDIIKCLRSAQDVSEAVLKRAVVRVPD